MGAGAVLWNREPPAEAPVAQAPIEPAVRVVHRVNDEQLLALLEGTPVALMKLPNGDIGLALGPSVTAGVAWHFIRDQNAGPPVVDAGAMSETAPVTAPVTASAAGGGAAVGDNNARAAKFEALDTDKDGKLALAEFSVGRKPAEAAEWFERRDTDRDGFLSREEFLPCPPHPKPREQVSAVADGTGRGDERSKGRNQGRAAGESRAQVCG